ncbi:hypothetical protein C8255_17940 [filamentous cyanobacterium CCP3]|nr:hypothetical protein C8255_17940 [filamentous cyanobacterium CCP3]
MRGWFETLGFRFEAHEVWQDNYFEWIIDVPVRRGRYDRILVRGIDGEAGLRDVETLKQSVKTQRTDEGWLVTARRISRAARDEVEKPENDGIGCYTLDELLDQDADFRGYLTWLEDEIQKRGIDRKYVPLACLKEDIDPNTKQRLGVSRYDDRDGWIDGYIDLWLDDPAKEHISVLGEFGTGKTWFALHYAWQALQRYREAQQRGLERPRLPLVIPLRDYAKAVSVESLFSEFFFRKHEIPIPGYSAFEQLNRMGKLLLIFDGFDEMAARVDRQQMINNFWALTKVVVPGAKVILTCRTEHFPEAKEGRALLNAELQFSTKDLSGDTPQFEALELEQFNESQIRKVLSYYLEPTEIEQIVGNPQLLDLARRPVLIELILAARPDIAGKTIDISRVYLYAVLHKMERDIREGRTFTSMADKLYFLCELSWEMFSTDRMSINYREFPDRIRMLFGPLVEEQKDLDHWHNDMLGQTMLIRNADGDYTLAHRSFLEFFIAYKLVAELGILPYSFVNLIQNEDQNSFSGQVSWTNYFQFRTDGDGQRISMPILKGFKREGLPYLKGTLGSFCLRYYEQILNMIVLIIDQSQETLEELLGVISLTKNKSEEDVGYIGGNIATILARKKPDILQGKDLRNTVIKGADFSKSRLSNSNFSNSILRESEFISLQGNNLSVTVHEKAGIFAAGDSFGAIHIWEIDKFGRHKVFRKKQIIKGHISNVWALQFAKNTNFLITASDDRQIKIWNIESGELIKTLEQHSSWVASIDLDCSGRILASGGGDNTIKLWMLATGAMLRNLEGHSQSIHAIKFHPANSDILVSGSSDNTIRIWDVESGNCLQILKGHYDSIFSVSFSLDGNLLVSGGADKEIFLWDVSDLQNCKLLQSWKGHDDDISSISFHPIEKGIIASASHDSTIKIWNTEKVLQEDFQPIYVLNEPTSWIHSITFSPDGNKLFCGCEDQAVYIWESSKIRQIKPYAIDSLKGYSMWVHSLALNSTGSILVSGYSDYMVRLWDAKTHKLLNTLAGHQGNVFCIACNPKNENTFASASYDFTVKIWNSLTSESRNLIGHSSWVLSVAFSHDGNFLASGSADKTVKLWSVSTGDCIHTFEEEQQASGHKKRVYSVSFNNTGKFLASASDDASVIIWDLERKEHFRTYSVNEEEVHVVAFSPIEEYILAFGGADAEVRLWDLESNELRTLSGHKLWINAVTFSPDGKKIASVSDQVVIIWDVETGEPINKLEDYPNKDCRLSTANFSVDGNTLVCGGSNGLIVFWDFRNNKQISIPVGIPYEEMNIKGVVGLSESQKSILKTLGAIEN